MNAYKLADVLENMADFDECEYQKSANMLRQQADHINDLDVLLDKKYAIIKQQKTLIDYYKVRDDSYQKTIAELEKEVKELHKIAQIMAMQESDARKSLQNYKDQIK